MLSHSLTLIALSLTHSLTVGGEPAGNCDSGGEQCGDSGGEQSGDSGGGQCGDSGVSGGERHADGGDSDTESDDSGDGGEQSGDSGGEQCGDSGVSGGEAEKDPRP